MMIDKKELTKLITKYELKAGKSLMLYQETGSARYDRSAYEAETIADALRVVLDSADSDAERLAMRAEISGWAERAPRGEDISGDVTWYARAHGLWRDVSEEEQK